RAGRGHRGGARQGLRAGGGPGGEPARRPTGALGAAGGAASLADAAGAVRADGRELPGQQVLPPAGRGPGAGAATGFAMTPTIDPVWPWSALLAALSGAALAVALLALLAGALTYALPLFGGGRGPRRPRLVRAGLVTGGMLLVWVLLGVRG